MGCRKIITADAKLFGEKAAAIFTEKAMISIEKRSAFSVAFSGGSTPRTFYRCLSEEPFVSKVSWENVHIFWVDERMVPYDHRDSNYGAAKANILDNIPIPDTNIHPMPVDFNPDQGAITYRETLESHFKRRNMQKPVFDLIMLGMGNDGHTASLFPGNDETGESDQWVRSLKGGNPDVSRITLTYPVLNMARCIIFLISGLQKSGMVKDIMENSRADLPAAKVCPENGELIWLLDDQSASLLQR